MEKLGRTDVWLLLLCVWLLSACAGTTQVEFEPVTELVKETPAVETEDVRVDDDNFDQMPEVREIIPYDMNVASTAEQLYRIDPGDSTSLAYAQAVSEDATLKYTIIYFDFNQSQIKEKARELLLHHALFMKAHPELKLRIEGHADQRGTSGYNLALGESRANAVRTVLETHGVAASRIFVISYGEEQPAIEGHTEEAFRLNRRAELIYP